MTGVFLLLPSMLSEDVFDIKKDSEGKCGGNNLQQKSFLLFPRTSWFF